MLYFNLFNETQWGGGKLGDGKVGGVFNCFESQPFPRHG